MSKLGELFKKNQTTSSSSESIKLAVPKLKNPNLLYWLSLIPLFVLALFIRTRNLPLLQGKYLIELDSYFFFRYAKMLFEQGSVPVIDYMRYVPVGTETTGVGTYLFFPKTLVFFYKIIHTIFPSLSQIEWHVIYPPVITIISFIFFFLFVKELLNHRIAFIATAFLAVIPAYLQRTGSGFADHEAVAMLWMFVSLWLFVVAWKSDTWKKYVPFAAVSGIFAAMLAATWGGYIFLAYGLPLFIFAYSFINNKAELKYLLLLGSWTITFSLFSVLLGVKSRFFGLPGAIIGFIMVFMLFQIVLPKYVKIEKLPQPILPLALAAAISLPAAALLKINLINTALISIAQKGVGRMFYTVSENAAPYFLGGWWESFSWIFLLAFAGSTYYFYKIFKSEETSKLKLEWFAAITYVLFFLAFIFGRFSQSGAHASIVNFFSNTYLYWLIGFLSVMCGLYLIAYYKDKSHLQNIQQKWPWLLLAIWFTITLLAARGQIRLLFATVPPIAIASAVFVSETIDFAKNKQKMITYGITIGIILLALFAFATAAQDTKLQNTYSGSMIPGQWEDAMTWIRTNTAEDAVFAHWWDYGYMTIALGERAAVTDGGNEKGWNYQSGRYFLTGKDDNSTLTYLKTHNVTHLLISEEEIMKYHAFSSIGSDENMDRYSTIGIFTLQQQKEVRDGNAFGYGGYWVLDKDYVMDKTVLSSGTALIGGFTIIVDAEGKITEAPTAHLINSLGKQTDLKVPCLILDDHKVEFETNQTINGCLMLIPYFDETGQGNPIGGAFWMSEKVYDTNFAKLYMFNETSPYFKQVYSDDVPLGVYQGRIVGPIKIWEVQYPENIIADPFYLQWNPNG